MAIMLGVISLRGMVAVCPITSNDAFIFRSPLRTPPNPIARRRTRRAVVPKIGTSDKDLKERTDPICGANALAPEVRIPPVPLPLDPEEVARKVHVCLPHFLEGR